MIMARNQASARIVNWRGKWYLFFRDMTQDPPTIRRLSCESLKATTAEARAELVKRYRTQEKLDVAEVVKRGGRLAYDSSLVQGLDEFLADCKRRAKARESNPESRTGISSKTLELLTKSVSMFQDWLTAEDKANLTTSGLDARHLRAFFESIATKKTKLGNKVVRRRAATVNQYMRNVRTALRWLKDLRPPRFSDFESLNAAFKPLRGKEDAPRAFKPSELQAFLRACLMREDPKRAANVVRMKDGKRETFTQTAPSYSATPTSRIFLMLALTGARLGEILALKWSDVDLERGRITIHAEKTGRTRVLPLINAPEGEVAPGLASLLDSWKLEAGKREYVLPHEGLDVPAFPKWGWKLALKDSEVKGLGPQVLRQNFTSYAASIGIPAAVAALWQGHAADVAEKHYRAQVLDRNEGESLEAAMGLNSLLGVLLAGLAHDQSTNSELLRVV